MTITYSNVAVTSVFLKRGNTIQNDRYLGLTGEVTVDTQAYTLRIHDGIGTGGHVIQSTPDLSNISSSILPSANVTYSLGSLTRQWKDLFVSNNTIYMGGTPLTINSSGQLTVGGNLVTGGGTSYSNVNTAAYTQTMGYTNYSNVNVAAYLTTQGVTGGSYSNVNATSLITSLGLTNYSNVNVAAYTQTMGYTNYSNVNVAAYTQTMGFQNYGNVNVSALITTNALTNYSNVNLTAYLGGSVTIGGNLTVNGNLFLNGNTTLLNTNNLIINDNIIYFANANPANSLDIGFVGHFTATRYQHTGLVRQATSGQWQLFSNVVAEPGNTIDFTNAIYDDIRVGNITSPTITGINANVAAANIGIIGYIDQANTIQSAQLTAANTAWAANASAQQTLISSLQSNAATQSDLIIGINANVTAANTGMRGYVDSQTFYSNARVATYLQSGNIANISAAGNVTATYFLGNGALLTGIVASGGGGTNYSNTNVIAYLNATGYNLYSNVNVAAYLAGTSYTGYSNVNVNAWFSGNIFASLYSNVNVAAYLAGNVTVGNLTTTSANITTNLTVGSYLTTSGSGGNISGVNYITANNIVGTSANTTITAGTFTSTFNNAGNVILPNVYVSGNVTANYILGNGALLTGIVAGGSSNYSNTNVIAYLNATGYNLYSNTNVIAYLNATGYNLYSNVNLIAYLAGNITTGNVTATGFIGNGAGLTNVTFSQAGNIVGTQSNVTLQAGTFTSVFNNQGNVTMPNVYVSGNVTTGGYFIGNGALLTGIVASGSGTNYSNVNVIAYLAGNVTMGTATGNTTVSLGGPTAPDATFPSQIALGINNTLYGNALGLANVSFTTGVQYFGNLTASVPHRTSGIYDARIFSSLPQIGANTSITSLIHFSAQTPTTGISSTANILQQYGGSAYLVGSASTGSNIATSAGWAANVRYAGNNYSFLSQTLPGPNNWAFYDQGGAQSYLAGNLTIANTTPSTSTTTGALIVAGGAGIGGSANVAGNVTAQYFLGNGALLTGIVASGSSYSNVQVATYLPTYSGNIAANISKAGRTWTFGTDGKLTFAGTLTNGATFDGNDFTAAPNSFIEFAGYTGNTYVGLDNDSVFIQTNWSTAGKQWTFANTGTLTLPASSGQIGRDGYTNGMDLYNNNGGTGYVRMNYADESFVWADATGAHVQSAGTYTWDFGTTGNLTLPSGRYILNSDNSIYGAGSSYSNVQVATYLPTYTGNIANIRLGTSGVLTFADGTTQTTAGGGSYSNVNVSTFLANSSTVFIGNVGNVATVYPLQSNITQVFIGGNTVITSGNASNPNATFLMYNGYFSSNGEIRVRNTTTGMGYLAIEASGFTLAGYTGPATANTLQARNIFLTMNGSLGAVFSGIVSSPGLTSTGAVAVNSSSGITTNQTSLPIAAGASTITIGSTNGIGNVFFGGNAILQATNAALGTNLYPLVLRPAGQYNYLLLTSIAGGYNSPPYTAQALTGGNGSGMTASYSSVGGYVSQSSLVVTNPGTGYRNGDILTLPNGLGTTVTLYNYNAAKTSNTAAASFTFGFDGNLTLPGNIIFPSSSYIFGDFSNATVNSRTVFMTTGNSTTSGVYVAPSGTGTGAAWQAANSSNLTAASKIMITTNGTTDVQLVSGINGAGTYLPLSFYNNGSAQMQLTVAGNLNMTVNNSIDTSGTGYHIGNSVGTTASYTGNVTVGNLSVASTAANAIVSSGGATVVGTVTSYGTTNATAFAVVGSGAVSNVALGFFPPAGTPAEMAIRDYSAANSTMYFDNTIGSANVGGQFQFRSTSSFTQWARIDRFGINLPTRPAFRVNGTAGPAQTTANVNLKSPQTLIIFNQGSYYNDTTGQFVAPVAGLYSVGLNARVNTNTSSQIAVLKNGNNSSGNIVCFWETVGNSGTATHYGVNGTILLAAGDYLSANILLGTITFDGNDNWHVTYLG